MERLQVERDVPLEIFERVNEPIENVIKRHVMVAGNYKSRKLQSVQKRTSLTELRTASTLCEIARNHDKIRTNGIDRIDKAPGHQRVGRSEMQVGDVRYFSHFSPGDSLNAILVPFNSSIPTILNFDASHWPYGTHSGSEFRPTETCWDAL
jgi:hypothetical protein